MRSKDRALECPECHFLVPPSKSIFRDDFRCPGCGTKLRVSLTYLRVLYVLAMLCGLLLIWFAGLRWIAFCLAAFPLGVSVFAVLLRVTPHIIRPRFVSHYPVSLTTLDLR